MPGSIESAPEMAVRHALVKLGYQEGIDFLGYLSGFYLPVLSLVLSIREVSVASQDRMQALALESNGVQVIYIDSEDALKNPAYYVQEALNGIDHSELAF